MNKYEAPPSPDYGNYLTQVNILHGNDVGGLGLRYNPVYFVFLDIFLRLFDEFTALKVMASIVFSTVAFPFFLLAKKFSNNNLAALISTWLFVFFEGYSEMIAWGGNPNFLAFSFLLLTLFFLVRSFTEPSKKNLLLTGFFFSLVIGTHFLVAAFALFSLLIFVALCLLNNKSNRKKVVKVLLSAGLFAAVLSLPYTTVYITFFQNSSSGLIGFNFLQQLSAIVSGFSWLFGTTFLIIGITVALGIFALAKYIKEDKTNGLLLCSLFSAPIFLTLVTEQPSRWLYFLPIPFFICFGLYLRTLFAKVRNVRKAILLLVICLILALLLVITISSVGRLDTSIKYYQTTGEDEIQAFRWIKESTPSNATFATSGPNKIIGTDLMPGSSYSWWIEGFSQRKSFHSGLPTWYTYEDERFATKVLNRIFAGTYIVEFNKIRIAENFPSAPGNPEIAMLVNEQYQNALFLNDAEQELTFSPTGNEQLIWQESPFYARNKTLTIEHTESWANITCTYEWANLRFIRNIIAGLEQSSVDIVFDISPINSTLKQFNVNLRSSYYTSIENYHLSNSTVFLGQRLLTGDLVDAKIAVLQTNGEICATNFLFKDPKYSMPAVTYSLKPLQNSLYVHFRVSINNNSEETTQPLRFFNSFDLINDLKINYIFLNKERTEYNMFLNDNKHFAVVFENEKIAIFRVL